MTDVTGGMGSILPGRAPNLETETEDGLARLAVEEGSRNHQRQKAIDLHIDAILSLAGRDHSVLNSLEEHSKTSKEINSACVRAKRGHTSWSVYTKKQYPARYLQLEQEDRANGLERQPNERFAMVIKDLSRDYGALSSEEKQQWMPDQRILRSYGKGEQQMVQEALSQIVKMVNSTLSTSGWTHADIPTVKRTESA